MIEYVSVLITIFLAAIIGIGIVLFSHFLGHRKSSRVKLAPYECGMETIGPTRVQINIRYYIMAMLFLIFDIEVIFIYPWAVIAKNLKLFGLIEMLIFILILFIGYIYVWKKGALEWESR